ncbi:SDR family oxidoreductase [Pseudolysinimonas kribbensis]|uniref:LysR family transcriptional regulator n=1 Tax=Pseudolysinimonas kribbensis TaxID=433641 RepID=A0ABQ6K8L6_9MICO|nr:SDR family oxidoreductase [Pseudolysinimonas kribbensis]GMA96764.1 LysR family transcriptional regulator [Pseudolysinimonas kribbensis]
MGGTGLIGTRTVARLRADGHDVIDASRATGVNTYTAEGLPEAVDGADVLVDVTNPGYFDEKGATEFFEVSTLNLLTHGRAAGVGHHIALSVVGTDRLARSEGGYFAAKVVQEQLIRESGRPYSIVHSTQFFEFLKSIADAAAVGGRVRLARARIQPIAADDVAQALAVVVAGAPSQGVLEIAGPERFRLDEVIRERLRYAADPREVLADPLARYFGARLDEDELLPSNGARIAATRLRDWLDAGDLTGMPA